MFIVSFNKNITHSLQKNLKIKAKEQREIYEFYQCQYVKVISLPPISLYVDRQMIDRYTQLSIYIYTQLYIYTHTIMYRYNEIDQNSFQL